MTEATLRDDSRRYVEAKLAYSYALAELSSVPPDRGALAAHTAVVLGKLLEYQQAFEVMATHDALFLLDSCVTPGDRIVAQELYRKLRRKLGRLTRLEQEFRAGRVVYSALVLAGRRQDRQPLER